jgi:hypothetical protein
MGTSIGLSRREHAQANPMSIVPVAIFILYTQPLTGKTNSNNTTSNHSLYTNASHVLLFMNANNITNTEKTFYN